MHYAQIEERATFECFVTLSLCPTGLGEVTQGYCEVFTHVCLIEWQNFTVRKPTQYKFWWNVNSYYRTWLFIYKVYCKYIFVTDRWIKGVTSGYSWMCIYTAALFEYKFVYCWRTELSFIYIYVSWAFTNLTVKYSLQSPIHFLAIHGPFPYVYFTWSSIHCNHAQKYDPITSCLYK